MEWPVKFLVRVILLFHGKTLCEYGLAAKVLALLNLYFRFSPQLVEVFKNYHAFKLTRDTSYS